MKKQLAAVIVAVLGLMVSPAKAFTTISVVPTAWVLMWIPGSPSTLWVMNTGSPCSYTKAYPNYIKLPDAATVDDMKAFYNAIVVAKTTSTPINVQYDETNSCAIVYFGNK